MKLREYFKNDSDIAKLLKSRFSISNADNLLDLNCSDKRTQVQWFCTVCQQTNPSSVSAKMRNPSACLVCSGQKVVSGVNDFASQCPELMKEWSPENQVDPTTITRSAVVSITWICQENSDHIWVTTPRERTRLQPTTQTGSQCPLCARLTRVITKRHQQNPNLRLPDGKDVPDALKTSFVKSLDKDNPYPSLGSNSNVLWRCVTGHEWERTPNKMKVSSNCPICQNIFLPASSSDTKRNPVVSSYPNLLKQWHPENVDDPQFTTTGSAKTVLWKCSQNHEWKTPVYARAKGYLQYGAESGCPQCANQISYLETSLVTYLSSIYDGSIILNSRNIISPYELDIYIPDKNIAIEFNGCYWHSEKFKSAQYHYEKWKKCLDQNIQLIQIWEDSWIHQQTIIEDMLMSKLGLNQEKPIGARLCDISLLEYKIAANFLDKNHIQGSRQGSVYVGLHYSDELVAVLVLSKTSETVWTLNRYASSKKVPGGFTKLLKFALKYIPSTVSQLITFAHHDVSDGHLYESTGWRKETVSKGDYSYLVQGIRVHKFNYRKKRFKNDPSLLFDSHLTESALASLNGLNKCWDSGKTKYVLDIL